MWFMTYEGELVNLARMTAIRIEPCLPDQFCLAAREAGTLYRLTESTSLEKAEALMLRIARELSATGYTSTDMVPTAALDILSLTREVGRELSATQK